MSDKKDDPINPSHYKNHPSGVECIQITENMSFCLGNAWKYLWRGGNKEDQPLVQDYKKSRWYLEREKTHTFPQRRNAPVSDARVRDFLVNIDKVISVEKRPGMAEVFTHIRNYIVVGSFGGELDAAIVILDKIITEMDSVKEG